MSMLLPALRSQASACPALNDGIALAATVAVFYTLCTVVWVLAPGPFLGFMNSLFHGMDFKPLLGIAPFSWTGFLAALGVMSVWAFLAGTCFGGLRRRLGT